MARRRADRVRPAELAVLGVGLVAVTVAGLTWTDAAPWSAGPGTALAAGRSGPAADAGTTDSEQPVAMMASRVTAGATDPAAVDDSPPAGGTDRVSGRTRSGGSAAGAAPVARPADAKAAAKAATPSRTGRMCLVLAPDAAFGAGHDGWAFRLADGRWVEGATENNTPNELVSLWDDANDDGSFFVEPGGETDSWMRTVSSFAQVRADFRGHLDHGGRLLHDAGYYTSMRCGDLPGADPRAAVATAREVTASGYEVGEDNCLTKAVDVFTAYGAHLPDASYELPDDYASRRLAPLGRATAI